MAFRYFDDLILSDPNDVNLDVETAAQINEHMRILDALCMARVLVHGFETPPSEPSDDASYTLGASPTGAWAGFNEHDLVFWQPDEQRWLRVVPDEGLEIWIPTLDVIKAFVGGTWVDKYGGFEAGGGELVEWVEMGQNGTSTQWSVGGTASDSIDAVDSDDDAKYMFETTDAQSHRYKVIPPAFGTGVTILSVQIEARAWRATGSSDDISLRAFQSGGPQDRQDFELTGSPQTFLSAPFARPLGGSWVYEDFDNLDSNDFQAIIRKEGASGDEIRVSRLRVKITYEE